MIHFINDALRNLMTSLAGFNIFVRYYMAKFHNLESTSLINTTLLAKYFTKIYFQLLIFVT